MIGAIGSFLLCTCRMNFVAKAGSMTRSTDIGLMIFLTVPVASAVKITSAEKPMSGLAPVGSSMDLSGLEDDLFRRSYRCQLGGQAA